MCTVSSICLLLLLLGHDRVYIDGSLISQQKRFNYILNKCFWTSIQSTQTFKIFKIFKTFLNHPRSSKFGGRVCSSVTQFILLRLSACLICLTLLWLVPSNMSTISHMKLLKLAISLKNKCYTYFVSSLVWIRIKL